MTLRAWLRLAAALLLLGFCLAGFQVSRLWGGQIRWVRRFLSALGRIVGLRVTIEGKAEPAHVLFVANHISWLDIIAIGGTTHARFVAKDEIARWPLVGSLARLAGVVFVGRDRRRETRLQANAVASALLQGRPVMLFAEGGTSDGSVVRAFRPALFASAVEAGVPVQPVAIDYGPDRRRYAWPHGLSFAAEARRMLNRTDRVPVTLRFLPVLDARTLDRKALAAAAQEEVAGALS